MAGVFAHAHSLIRDRRFGVSCGLSLVLHRSSDHSGEPEYTLGQSLEFGSMFYAILFRFQALVLVCSNVVTLGSFCFVLLVLSPKISYGRMAIGSDDVIFGL